MLGPFISRGWEKQHAISIHERGGEATRMVRDSFAALRKALAATGRR